MDRDTLSQGSSKSGGMWSFYFLYFSNDNNFLYIYIF